jgi:phenylacetate-CoA ligase
MSGGINSMHSTTQETKLPSQHPTRESCGTTLKESIQLRGSGSRERAWAVVERMYGASSAYRELIDGVLREAGKRRVRELSWEQIPIITKESFYKRYPAKDYVPAENVRDTYTMFRSSGTTAASGNQGFLWPQLRADALENSARSQEGVIQAFSLHEKRTLVIIGSTLGSWLGGEHFSFVFKAIAQSVDFPMTVFTPGKNHAEIIEVIEAQRDNYDQFLIVMVPSTVYYLEYLAEKQGARLPYEKITYFVLGEPFSEGLRKHVITKAGRDDAMISLYGAADTGCAIGVDSAHLVRARQFLGDHAEVAARLGIPASPVPNLFHLARNDDYLEIVDGELIITKWQGVPLLRYNLKDRVQLIAWRRLCEALAGADVARREYWRALSREDLTDVITVAGRNDGCEFLGGTNLFGPMLEEVVNRSRLGPAATGAFVAWVKYEGGRQMLGWQIELKPDRPAPSGGELHELHSEFVRLLGEQQPEFIDDYNALYRHYEADGLYIFDFHFCEAPALTEHPQYNSKIKRKILIEKGPLA